MATIANIVQNGKGKAHAWRVTYNADEETHTLWHYSTPMLTWRNFTYNDPRDNDLKLVDYNIGHGSVSDQNGMNTAFRILNMPYRYHRDDRGGGPRIERY